eukprot:CAMPEP_0171225660 /NCGR_PEP_ID=MMETSP0790-20130122/36921_1 /TAXON_ID=2925 /ORGANISM="Alexandrium catenella, Strain OF101" /LENGTH=92 /DNA_ID=CAMNT_0011691699 /DNA_START=215 /DNA_END=493 /DNA_ORIENTATION=+
MPWSFTQFMISQHLAYNSSSFCTLWQGTLKATFGASGVPSKVATPCRFPRATAACTWLNTARAAPQMRATETPTSTINRLGHLVPVTPSGCR